MKRVFLLVYVAFCSVINYAQVAISLYYDISDFTIFEKNGILQIGTKLSRHVSSGDLEFPKFPYFSYKILLPLILITM